MANKNEQLEIMKQAKIGLEEHGQIILNHVTEVATENSDYAGALLRIQYDHGKSEFCAHLANVAFWLVEEHLWNPNKPDNQADIA